MIINTCRTIITDSYLEYNQFLKANKLSVEIFETQIVCHMMWVKQEPE